MAKIVPIVEGQGETQAVLNLCKRILLAMGRSEIQIAEPRNAKGRDTLIKKVEQFVQDAWNERDCVAVLILLDADDDCPVTLAQELVNRVRTIGLRHSVVVAVARREYEVWFLASLSSIAGKDIEGRTGLPASINAPHDIENISGVKEWLSKQFPKGRTYKPTLDQLAMTRLMDVELAKQNSRSFQRFCHAIEQAVAAIDANQAIITP